MTRVGSTTAIPLDVLCRLRNIPTDVQPALRRTASDSNLSPPRPPKPFLCDLQLVSPPKTAPQDVNFNTRFIRKKVKARQNQQKIPSTSVPTAPIPPMSTPSAAIAPQPSFYGDYENGEEPTNWIRKYQLSLPPSYSDADKISRFELQCAAASPAEAWFASLTAANTTSWSTFITAFKTRWPPPAQVALSVAQKKDRIRAVVLKDEEVGVMIEEDRGSEWGHVKWARKIVRMAQGFNDSQCHLLDVVLENTPEVLRDFLSDNYSTWADFEADVSKVSASHLLKAKQRLALEKKLREDVNKLQSQITSNEGKTTTTPPTQQTNQSTFATPSPYRYGYRYAQTPQAPPPQLIQPSLSQLPHPPQPIPQPYPIIQNPQVPQTPQANTMFTTATPAARGNLFYGYRGGYPQTPTRGRGGSLADRTRLAAQYATIPHHPDSDTGKQAYAQQVQEWHTAHGADAIPNSSRPYPLKPGTAPLGSRECFNCGLATAPTHQAYECNYPAVPAQETKWRETVSRLVSRTLATAPLTGTPANVQFVAPAPPHTMSQMAYQYYAPPSDPYGMYDLEGNGYGPQQ